MSTLDNIAGIDRDIRDATSLSNRGRMVIFAVGDIAEDRRGYGPAELVKDHPGLRRYFYTKEQVVLWPWTLHHDQE